MGNTKNTGYLQNIIQYDASNNIVLPANLTVTGTITGYATTASLGSYVPTSRTITINGTTYDLSSNREWNITSMIYPAAGIALSTGSAWGSSITNNSANWNTAYGWGNHAVAGYLTSINSSQVTTALGFTPVTNARTITINGTAYDLSADRSWTVSGTDSTKMPLAGGTFTGLVTFAFSNTDAVQWPFIRFGPSSTGWDEGIIKASSTEGVFGRYGMGIHFDSARAFGIYSSGWTKVMGFKSDEVLSYTNIRIGNQQGFDNSGGWNKNVLIDATNHGRFRIRASNYSYGNIDTYLWADSSVTPSHGIYGSNSVFAFNGNITSVTISGQTVIHTGNIGSQSVNYANSAGSASSASRAFYSLDGFYNSGAHGSSIIENYLPAANNGAGTGIVALRMWCSEPGVTWDYAGFGYNVKNDGGSPSGFGRYNTSFGQAYMRFATDGNWYFYNTNTSGTRVQTMQLTPSANAIFGGKIINASVWINNGAEYNGYNENIRLFNAPNGVSVIAFSASGESGQPTTSILGYSDRLEFRYASGAQLRIWNGYVTIAGSLNTGGKITAENATLDSHFLAAGGAPSYRLANSVSGPSYQGLLGLATYYGHFVSMCNPGDTVVLGITSGGRIFITSGANGAYMSYNATSFTSNSDIRLKNVVGHLDNALDKISTLSTIKYTWKSDATNKVNIGLVAQEVLAVFPELVDISNDTMGTLGVRYSEMIPVVVKGIQEQQNKIDELTNMVSLLQETIQTLLNK